VRITRRHLQLALGALWLLDGAMQCQPIMFTRAFTHHILAPTGVGQPSFIAEPLHILVSLVSTHPALVNGTFALVQILIGLALFTRRFTKVALAASIGWALSVWFLGEGLGGLATGATLLSGAPGAALLYAIIALVAWPARDGQIDERPSWLALPMWSALWLGAAALQLINGNDSTTSITMMLRSGESSAPTWIAGIDRHLVRQHFPLWTIAAMIAVFVLVAIWALIPGWTRQLSIGIGVVISLGSWLLFQGLGNLTSGQATDPNSGPLIVLLALAVVGAYSHNVREQVSVKPHQPVEAVIAVPV